MFGDKVPAELKKLSEADFQATLYNAFTNVPIHPAMETTSASFKNSEDYGLTAYVKTAEWMYMLEQSIGMEKVDNAFQHYFNTWRFKHPGPLDMRAAFEEAIHGGLENYFALLYKEDKLVQ